MALRRPFSPPGGPGGPRRRMALLTGCAQSVLAPEINAAAVRLLNRAGIEVVVPKGEGCCGSLAHHMGAEERALAQARADIEAWTREMEGEGLEAIVVTTSGCGATIKDYGHMLRDDPAFAEKAKAVASIAKDISEVAQNLDLEFARLRPLVVAYHAACSLQHGQKIADAPKALLRRAGFEVRAIPEVASLLRLGRNLQHPPARDRQRSARPQGRQHRARQAGRDRRRQYRLHRPDRLSSPTPVVHTVELLDWASGGPAPAALA